MNLPFQKNDKDRLLMCGDWSSDYQEESLANGFVRIGYEVTRFKTKDYFCCSENYFSQFLMRLQRKLILGPRIWKLNFDLLRIALRLNPTILFLYRNTQIYPLTIRIIKKRSLSIIVCYNNDNAFSESASWYQWRLFFACLKLVDLALAFRQSNIVDFQRKGAKQAILLGTWFDPARHFPVCLTTEECDKYSADIVFVGHFENDGRLEYLEEVKKLGLRLRIFGPSYEWDKHLKNSKYLQHVAPTQMVWGSDYPKALSGASIALCFFSKLNQDEVTTRCFEIPACGTLLVSEWSSYIEKLYVIGEEALTFKNKQEFRNLLIKYFSNQTLRSKLSLAGQKRAWTSQYDVYSKVNFLHEVFIQQRRKV